MDKSGQAITACSPELWGIDSKTARPTALRLTAEQPIRQNLPELALIEGNQQVATNPDESLSPSLFTFRPHFAAIHHD